jgi:drug/metabolite transporter (DMT)-like permease
MVGAFVVVTAGGSVKTLNWHAALVLLAALSWSVYFTLQRHHAKHYGALEMTCYTVWSGTLLLLIYSPGLIDRATHAPMGVNLAVGILGVFPSALAYLWWAKVLERTDVSTAAPALYLVPPVSMIMASVALNERTPTAVIVGAMIVICSVLLVNLEHHRIALRKRFNVLRGNSVNGK